jgi:hypothetical protein
VNPVQDREERGGRVAPEQGERHVARSRCMSLRVGYVWVSVR